MARKADCYLESTGRASPPGTLKEDASFQSLQSTCCHGTSQDRLAHELGAFTLPIHATLVEPRTRHACTERDTSRPRGRRLAVAGITCLEWRIGLAPITPAVTRQSPPLGTPGNPGMTRAGVFNRCTRRDSKITDVSVHPQNKPGCPVPARRARALSAYGAPTPQLPKLRNAFLPQILMTSLLAGARSGPSRQRSVPGFGHPGLMLDTRSHTVSGC